ncbi:VanZ family protein [candidate division TA06 bacterium]|uniref:VanZ family protein n=1 Tax=candidate division TA06 bacterium TaxID=2250710 RepID=A0A933I856_UNCT6|nr:VanZ family protein [candidate division TA06 bacterium]
MRKKIIIWGPVAAWLVLMVTATSIPNLRTPSEYSHADPIFHLAAYLALAVLAARAVFMSDYRHKGLWAVLLVLGLGLAAIDEYHERWIPGRTVSFLDFSMDAIGFAAGAGLSKLRYKNKDEDQ